VRIPCSITIAVGPSGSIRMTVPAGVTVRVDNRDVRRLDHALVASALSGGPGGHVVNVSEIAEYRVAGPVSERSRGERYGQSG
jgi:hypothetical protein